MTFTTRQTKAQTSPASSPFVVRRAGFIVVQLRCSVLAACLGTLVPAASADLVLEVDPAQSFETFIFNPGLTIVSADAYTISSPPPGRLDDSEWQSISDSLSLDSGMVQAQLGDDVRFFGELRRTPDNLSEANLFGVGAWQPGVRWSIGHPFGRDASAALPALETAQFTYLNSSVSTTPVTGAITVIPEPATAQSATMLLVLLFVIITRERQRRSSSPSSHARSSETI